MNQYENIELKNYGEQEILFYNQLTAYFEITNQTTRQKNIAKIWNEELSQFTREQVVDLYREVYINSQIVHPCFLKFVGFSHLNFQENENPVIVFEHFTNGSLEIILNSTKPKNKIINSHIYRLNLPSDENETNEEIIKLNDTQKLIIIFGIAAGMSYLHSNNILHRNLNPSSIFLDDSFYPKISGLDIVKELFQSSKNDEPRRDGKLKGVHKYLAPEILTNLEYGKPSDVYAFSILMFEIMTEQTPFKNMVSKDDVILNVSEKGIRPIFESKIPSCYQKLIEKCWSQDPKKRLTFDEIVSELKNNPEFITEEVNEEEFKNYIKLIVTSPISFEPRKTIKQLERIWWYNPNEFRKSTVDLSSRGLINSETDINIKNFKMINDNFNEVVNEESNIRFVADFNDEIISNYLRCEIKSYARSMNILSKLNHPAIIKLIGYSSVDFKNLPKPVCIVENHLPFKSFTFDDTDKLIIIYGIASAMAYLHSHNILHRNLKTESIVGENKEDDFCLPKLYGFDIAKEISNESIKPNKTIKGTPAFIAPEVYLNKGYSKSSDVYSFGLIMYELLTGDKPYSEFKSTKEIKRKITEEHYRPPYKHPILPSYRELIEKCLSEEPNKRPTFDEIVSELKNNPDFIMDSADKNSFLQYVSFINEFPVTYDPDRKIKQLDDILSSKLHLFADIKPKMHFSDTYQAALDDLFLEDINFLELDSFKILNYISDGNFYRVFRVVETETKAIYASKKSQVQSNDFFKHEIINFSRELSIIFCFNHPAIMKFKGYVLDKNDLPIIICEYSSKGSLGKIQKLSKEKKATKNSKTKKEIEDTNLDSTKKLIIIYGIAIGMAYLHSHNILHRDLKLDNIYLDGNLYPKISGFNIVKEISNDLIEPNKTIKGTPAFIAPEVYLNKGYSKSSDVYSFGLIMYELLTGDKPYSDLKSAKEIKRKITEEHYRPPFKHPILPSYRELIEKCLSEEPNKRPTFDEIVSELKNNPDFIIDKDHTEEFQSYIQFTQDSPISFETNRRINQLEDYVKSKLYLFKENLIQVNFKNIFETETNNVFTNYDVVDIKNYTKEKLIQKEHKYKTYIIRNIQTGAFNIAKKYTCFKYKVNNEKLVDFSGEINNIMKINHPLFLKFISYSPVDIKNNPNPFIVFENASNSSLDIFVEVGKKNKEKSMFTDTRKLIILFGIASAMAYLHSINIIHCNLKPSNIFLDEYLFPKITGFDISKPLSENPIRALSEIIDSGGIYYDNNIHNPPELMKSFIFSPAGDVYAFAVIAYRLITEEIPFLDEVCYDGYRPDFKESTPDCYRKLIDKCWAQDPKERPTFDEIVNHLKTNPEFITEKIDKEEFSNYVQLIEEINQKYRHNNGKDIQIDNFIKTQNQRFRKVKIDFKKLRDWSRLHFSVSIGSSDLNKYEKIAKIGSGNFGVVYKVKDKQEGKEYAAKVSILEMDQCPDDDVMNLIREIDIISALNHPSILKFIGFSPNNFKNKPKPVIITEYAQNGSLDKILEMERLGLGNHEWNDTKKLINIYGIAAGMSYLISRNIIHRDLKPANILLDEYLYPKIADFGLSKDTKERLSLDPKEDKRQKSAGSGFKGTYIYSAPEVMKDYAYSDISDVYSYAMIVYEIITGEAPYKGLNQFQLINLILSGKRPKFNHQIPYYYKNLIKKCWCEKASSRPSFKKICKFLEEDPSFLTPNIDKEEYLNYVGHINEFLKYNYKTTNENIQNNKQPDSAKNKFTKVLIDLKHIDEVDDDFSQTCDYFINLDKFQRQDNIIKKDSFKIYQICEKETHNIFAAQISMVKIDHISKEEIEKLSNDLKIISQLNHPSLLKFVGFSLTDFKKDKKPVIITELPSNRTIEEILEVEKMNKKITGWDDTKKLINIYGIASGMSYMHSYGILHKCLKPSNIFLDDILFPKIGDFGLSTRFYNIDNISHQSISGQKGTPIYSAPEVLQNEEYSKSSDVYSFAFVVYEILMNEKPYSDITTTGRIFEKVVIKGERPKMKDSIPQIYKDLIERCWSQDPKERPEFKDIVYHLKNDPNFITDNINIEDYRKYIDYIESQIDEKFEENLEKVNENSSRNSDSKEVEESFENKYKFIDDSNQADILIKFWQDSSLDSIDVEKMKIIDEYISTNDASKLMNFINNNCNNEETSFIFDYCYSKSHILFLNLCKEGISYHNSVAHHKYAISLISNSSKDESKDNLNHIFMEVHDHLKESINRGFTHSCFLLALLYHEVYKDDKLAFRTAKEGSEKGEKYSKCLLGYFIARGNGTKKEFEKGVSMIIDSEATNLYELFATIIGIYYSRKSNEEINKKETFKWFEKAFNLRQNEATINNYGICFSEGIGVDKNVEKAKEIFRIGVSKNDPNSMYHLAFLLEKTDAEESKKYYKISAELGDSRSQLQYGKMIENDNPDLSIKYLIKASDKNTKAREFLAMKYIERNDTENIYKYVNSLLKTGNFSVPLKYAIVLYKTKEYKKAFSYFSKLSEFNHPIAYFYIGMMKFRGEGCEINKKESYEIMKNLSKEGIDRATEFIHMYMQTFEKDI